MDWSKLSDSERLVAEQAVLTYQAMERAALQAPYGKGLECLEAVIHAKGMEHLRTMFTTAASARPEAQKKGSASKAARAGKRRSSNG